MTRQINRVLQALLLLLLFTCGILAGNAYADGELRHFNLSLNGEYMPGTINNKDDVDRYKISVPTSGTLSVSYQGQSIKNGYYQLMDESVSNQFFKRYISSSSDTSPKTDTQDLILEKGIYYLNVWSYGSNTGNYRVRASFTAAGNNEPEPNNTFETAISLAQNVKVTGLISETDTVDFFKIHVPAAQKIKITYQGMISTSYFTLYDGNLEEKHKRYVSSGSEASPYTYVYEPELSAGVYYIKVIPYNSKRGRYTLSWTGTGTAAPDVGATVTYSQQQYTVSGGSTVSYSKPSTVSTTVTIPDTITVGGVVYKVTAVSKEAFKDNKQITKVILGKNVKTIYGQAFAGCTSLKTVKFANVVVIGKNAFSGCISLKKIDLPATLKKINAGAFSGCKKLKKIIVRSSHLTKAKVGSGAFKGTSAKPTVSVPAKKLKKYKKIFKGISKSARFISIG